MRCLWISMTLQCGELKYATTEILDVLTTIWEEEAGWVQCPTSPNRSVHTMESVRSAHRVAQSSRYYLAGQFGIICALQQKPLQITTQVICQCHLWVSNVNQYSMWWLLTLISTQDYSLNHKKISVHYVHAKWQVQQAFLSLCVCVCERALYIFPCTS